MEQERTTYGRVYGEAVRLLVGDGAGDMIRSRATVSYPVAALLASATPGQGEPIVRRLARSGLIIAGISDLARAAVGEPLAASYPEVGQEVLVAVAAHAGGEADPAELAAVAADWLGTVAAAVGPGLDPAHFDRRPPINYTLQPWLAAAVRVERGIGRATSTSEAVSGLVEVAATAYGWASVRNPAGGLLAGIVTALAARIARRQDSGETGPIGDLLRAWSGYLAADGDERLLASVVAAGRLLALGESDS